MRRRFDVGRKRAGILSTAIAGSLLLLAIPDGASAEPGYRPQRHHEQHAHVYSYSPQGRQGGYAHCCGICGRGYKSHPHLQRHLHHHHHRPLALWNIPRALFPNPFRWGHGD
jgi:hypothetical protein